jgi:GNAT superfamily N-acetyltransferase
MSTHAARLQTKIFVAKALLAKLKAWDESKHPRGEHGRWTAAAAFERAGIELRVEGTDREQFARDFHSYTKMTPAQFKNEYMGGLPGTFGVKSIGPLHEGFVVGGQVHDQNGKKIGHFMRWIMPDRKEAEQKSFELDEAHQGSGIGKKLLAGNVAMYQKLGIEKVGLIANSEVGAYAWAKYGFVPTPNQWGFFADTTRTMLPVLVPARDQARVRSLIRDPDPKTIWELADSKYGKKLLLGHSWEGALNLKDPEAMRRFRAYVGNS